MSRIRRLPGPFTTRFILAVLVVVTLADHVPGALALIPGGGDSPVVSAAVVSNAFTFQGRLNSDGVPPSGVYDFEFRLFDNGTAGVGSPLGSGVITKNDLAVENGLFATQLDFGAGVFSGDARWVEVRVRDGASTGGYTTLPRQELTATPYALVALNFAAHDHLGEDWIGSDASLPGLSVRNLDNNGTALYAEAGRIGLQALTSAANGYGVWGQADGANGVGVRGTGSTGVLAEGSSRGVSAFASGAGGVGVRGEAGAGTGVLGYSNATGWAAITGHNQGSGCNSGSYEDLEDNCIGVYGAALNGGLGIGVVGDGAKIGVFGKSAGVFGSGVQGVSTDGDGVGVRGINRHTSCVVDVFANVDCAGVAGIAVSLDGGGVVGMGGRIGIWGEPNLNPVNGIGIYGKAHNANQWAGYFDGKVYAASFTSTPSDARLKTNLAPSAGLAEVLRLNPVSFDWIAYDGLRHQGLIAQEVAEVFPDLVSNAGINGEERLAVAYEELIPVLVRAIQEQQAQIAALQAAIQP